MPGRTGEANEEARHAWLAGITDAPAEAAFLHRWSGALRPDDQWARFQHLAWRDAPAAARQVPRLDPAHRAQAEARLALQRDASNAETLLAALPAAARSDPGMVLDHARWLRHADRHRGRAGAVAARRRGSAAMTRPDDQLAAFWTERNLLARRLLHDGNAAGAYALAADHGQHRPGAGAGRRVPGRLHRPAPAERPRRGHPPLHALSPDCPRRRSPRAARITGWAARTAAAGKDPRPDYRACRRLADDVLRPARRSGAGRRCRGTRAAGSPRCTTRPTRATRCWHSPTARWCVPRPCWSHGTIRTAPAPSCCGWTSLRPTRPTGP